MSEADRDLDTSREATSPLLACCQWVVEAHADGDPQQEAVALSELYRLLGDLGWIPPPRASVLLRVQAAALEVACEQLLMPQARQD